MIAFTVFGPAWLTSSKIIFTNSTLSNVQLLPLLFYYLYTVIYHIQYSIFVELRDCSLHLSRSVHSNIFMSLHCRILLKKMAILLKETTEDPTKRSDVKCQLRLTCSSTTTTTTPTHR
jgi:hypothetical protein